MPETDRSKERRGMVLSFERMGVIAEAAFAMVQNLAASDLAPQENIAATKATLELMEALYRDPSLDDFAGAVLVQDVLQRELNGKLPN
jgi:hypothetical protein